MAVTKPENELERLAALRKYRILDTPPEKIFDDIARLAAYICGTSSAVISLVDEDREWFKSAVGVDISETPRSVSFCTHTILQDDVLVVSDTLEDPRFAESPLVTSGPKVRSYAGSPLITPAGYAIGTLCVQDSKPREFASEQLEALQVLSRQVVTQLELRRSLTEAEANLGIVVEEMPCVLWSVDTDLRFNSSVGAGLANLGLRPDEVVGMTLYEYFGTDDHKFKPIAAHLRALDGEGSAFESEWDDRAFQCYVGPFRASGKEITGAIGVAFDVTERKQAEELLRRSQTGHLWSSLFQTLGRGASAILYQSGLEAGSSTYDFLKRIWNPQDRNQLVTALDEHFRTAGLFRQLSMSFDGEAPRVLTKVRGNFETLLYEDVTNQPVCHFLRGLICGFSQRFLRVSDLVCDEVACEARGDETCEFVVRPMFDLRASEDENES